MFSVWPVASMTPKVAMREAGMPAMTQKATRTLRNVMRIRVTRIRPPVPFLTSKLILSLSRLVVASYRSMTRFAGRVGSTSSRYDSTALACRSASELTAR